MLDRDQYRNSVALDHPFTVQPAALALGTAGSLRGLIELMVADGTAARLGIRAEQLPSSDDELERRRLLRALLTVRASRPIPDWFNTTLDALLQRELAQRGVVGGDHLPRIRDLARLFVTSVAAPEIEGEHGIPFQVFYGVSANTRSAWSIANARRVVGCEPQDDSEVVYADEIRELILEPARERTVQGDARGGKGSR